MFLSITMGEFDENKSVSLHLFNSFATSRLRYLGFASLCVLVSIHLTLIGIFPVTSLHFWTGTFLCELASSERTPSLLCVTLEPVLGPACSCSRRSVRSRRDCLVHGTVSDSVGLICVLLLMVLADDLAHEQLPVTNAHVCLHVVMHCSFDVLSSAPYQQISKGRQQRKRFY